MLFVGCSLPHDINTGKPILWSEVPNYFLGPFFREEPNWDFWDDPLRQNIKCPEGEHCLDLTERMGGLEGKIFKTLKPKRGWKGKGCVHGKQIDPLAKEAMPTNLSIRLTLCQIAFSDPSINLWDNPPRKIQL